MRSHQYLKIKPKTRRKYEQKTACSLQERSANLTNERAFSAKVRDNKVHTTPDKSRSVVRPSRRAHSAKDTVKKAPTTSGALRTVGSQLRRAVPAKQAGYLSLITTYAMAGKPRSVVRPSRRANSAKAKVPVDSCSPSTSAVSLKYNSRGTRDGNLSFLLQIQIPKVRLSQITKLDYTNITRKSPHSATNKSVTDEMRKRKYI
jgi:hypothetical protein